MLIRHSFKLCQESIFHYNLDLQDLALYSQALSRLVDLPEMVKCNACQPQAISGNSATSVAWSDNHGTQRPVTYSC